jgi:hypothetical protein
VGHAEDLEPKIRELRSALQDLSKGEQLDELIELIHRPGWTTLAEVAFVEGVIGSLIAQTETVQGLKNVLLSASSRIELNPQPLPP